MSGRKFIPEPAKRRPEKGGASRHKITIENSFRADTIVLAKA